MSESDLALLGRLGAGPDSGAVLVEAILRRSLRHSASDVHLDSAHGKGRVRLRIDGMLDEQPDLSKEFDRLARATISRLKIMAGLDIAEHRLPQDGSFTWQEQDIRLDARLSLVPAWGGERAVIRLIQRTESRLMLDDLGMNTDSRGQFAQALSASQGLILVTGPTGSGKTTTLYAALEQLNSPDRCILSVEDPVERALAGVSQVQVNPAIGLDFQRVLRAFLRQDPQVLMVGEMRDAETAQIAVRASLTGHLVLSTLHARNSLSSVARLRDMGLENWLLSASLSLIVAQRLVRRLCPDCRHPDLRSADLLSEAQIKLPTGAALMAATGCARCGNRGYSGRMAVFEVLPVSAALASAILAGEDKTGLRRATGGFADLRHAAVRLLASGDLSAEEFFRVLG